MVSVLPLQATKTFFLDIELIIGHQTGGGDNFGAINVTVALQDRRNRSNGPISIKGGKT